MAEALYKDQLVQAGQGDGWRVESAGAWAVEGARATDFARQVMRERGLDIDGHSSRPVTEEMLQDFDLILVMEARHKEFLHNQFPKFAERIYLMSGMIDRALDVEDPVWGTLETYRVTVEEMVDILERGNDCILELT